MFILREFPIPPINDGYWHHVSVTWSLGTYVLYLDGALISSGDNFGASEALKAGGVFYIGQKYLSDGTFDDKRSFHGRLSQLNIWSEVLSADTIKSTSETCYNNVGTILDWSSVVDRINGDIFTEPLMYCVPLRNSKGSYIIMATPSHEICRLEFDMCMNSTRN